MSATTIAMIVDPSKARARTIVGKTVVNFEVDTNLSSVYNTFYKLRKKMEWKLEGIYTLCFAVSDDVQFKDVASLGCAPSRYGAVLTHNVEAVFGPHHSIVMIDYSEAAALGDGSVLLGAIISAERMR